MAKTSQKTAPGTKKSATKVVVPKVTKKTALPVDKLWEEQFKRYYYHTLNHHETESDTGANYPRNVYMSYDSLLDASILTASNPKTRVTLAPGTRTHLVNLYSRFVTEIKDAENHESLESIASSLVFDFPLTFECESLPEIDRAVSSLDAECVGQLNNIGIGREVADAIVAKYMEFIHYIAHICATMGCYRESFALSGLDFKGFLRISGVPADIVDETAPAATAKKTKAVTDTTPAATEGATSIEGL